MTFSSSRRGANPGLTVPSSTSFSSVPSLSLVSRHSLRPHGLHHTRPPCPSPTHGVHPDPCPLSQWCHPTISSSVVPFSCPQSFPASGSFQMSQFFALGGQSIGASASASVLPIQDWFPLGHCNHVSISYIKTLESSLEILLGFSQGVKMTFS